MIPAKDKACSTVAVIAAIVRKIASIANNTENVNYDQLKAGEIPNRK
jgi:hypothetical protein